MNNAIINDDWDIVKQMLPADLDESARQLGALRRTRKVKNAETLLKLIFLHVAGGLSLRQTVARAESLGWAELSDVALLKRLRSCGNWLEYLCSSLWQGWQWPKPMPEGKRQWRIIDATTIQEPGATQISWRVHYTLRLPLLTCDYVSVTTVRGGETLCRIPVRTDDVFLADRGYSQRAGVAWVLSQGGHVIVRHQGNNFPLKDRSDERFDLLKALRALCGHVPKTWEVAFEHEGKSWNVWLHAVRKSREAAEKCKEELRRERGAGIKAETLELAEYVVVLSSLPPKEINALQALGLYRGRWQIELVFKVLKGLLNIGDLAKYDPGSAKAWIQAKLLTALLIEKLEREAGFFSPWGFPLLGSVESSGVSGSSGQFTSGDCSSNSIEKTDKRRK